MRSGQRLAIIILLVAGLPFAQACRSTQKTDYPGPIAPAAYSLDLSATPEPEDDSRGSRVKRAFSRAAWTVAYYVCLWIPVKMLETKIDGRLEQRAEWRQQNSERR